MTKEVREDRHADEVVQAVGAVDDQVTHIGDSVQKAVSRQLKKD